MTHVSDGGAGVPRMAVPVVLAGPSGVGKGTVVRAALDRLDRARTSLSATTRAARPGEEHGVHYLFVDDAEFDRLIEEDALLEHASYAGNRYGTTREMVETALAEGSDVLFDIEVQGALQLRERLPGVLLIFLMPPSLEELERRLRGRRTEDAADIARRLDTARWEMTHQDAFDHVIVNDDLERCVDEVVAAIEAARQGRAVPHG